MKHNGPNDSAFPTLGEVNGKEVVGSDGLTVREWYAGLALQGLLAFSQGMASQYKPEEAAREAFQFADAMLAEARK